MTFISACGDVCDDEDIYPCVLNYLIDNCPFYADLKQCETNDYNFSSIEEQAFEWENRLRY